MSRILHDQGHIDHHVREAIRAGVDPILAWRMATLTAALYYRLDHLIGSITPSRLADLQLVPDLDRSAPGLVLVDGAWWPRTASRYLPRPTQCLR